MRPRQGLCRALGFPTKVLAAALVFLKRFYLAFSVLDHDPKNFMLTCIYLAGKARPGAQLYRSPRAAVSWSPGMHVQRRDLRPVMSDAGEGRRGGCSAVRWLRDGCWEGHVGLATHTVSGQWNSCLCGCRTLCVRQCACRACAPRWACSCRRPFHGHRLRRARARETLTAWQGGRPASVAGTGRGGGACASR
jgi:hypothetical protein